MSWSKWGIYSKKLTVCVLVLALILSSGFNSFTVYADNAANGQGKGFSDIEGHWAKEQVEDWSGKGLVSGYDDGTFKPERGVTRAETVALLSKAVGTLYNAQGVYGPEEGKQTIAGNVTVSVSGVTLKNLVIEGDLFLTAGIGDGDFEADGVVVKGRTVVSGGGEESVVFNNTSLEEVIVYVVDGKVRIVAKGDTDIGKVVLESGAHLQEEGLTGDGFGDVQVLVLKPGESIELEGDFDRVEIETAVEVSITGDTRIGELEVSEGAKGTKIDTGKDTVIENLTLNAGTDVTGKGTIKTAYVNTDDYSFEKEPEKIVVGGEEVKEEKKPSGGGGGGGGGDDGEKQPVALDAVNDISVQVNGTQEIKLTTNATNINATSSNTNVVVVDVKLDKKTLIIKGIGEGKATITVTGRRSRYEARTVTFEVEVVPELKLLSSFPKNMQQDFYPKYTYITLEFSESMRALDDPGKIFLVSKKDGERVNIYKVPVGIDYSNCVLLVVYNDLKLDTEYDLYIPPNTFISESEKLYDEPINISFRTAHTVLKGRIYSRLGVEGYDLELLPQAAGQVTKSVKLTDGGYIFINPEPGLYIIRVTNTQGKVFEKQIEVKENVLNVVNMELERIISNILEATIEVLEVAE